LKPERGKPAFRNFREGDGNGGIIRSPLRAIALPDRFCHLRGRSAKPAALLRRDLLEKIPVLQYLTQSSAQDAVSWRDLVAWRLEPMPHSGV
jgi:hypothetical protein